MTKRIIGLDVARALAIFGMVIVHFKMVFGNEGSELLQAFANIFDGKASATFVVLAGVGLSLMTKNTVNDPIKFQVTQKSIIKRSIFLFVIGLSYYTIWASRYTAQLWNLYIIKFTVYKKLCKNNTYWINKHNVSIPNSYNVFSL